MRRVNGLDLYLWLTYRTFGLQRPQRSAEGEGPVHHPQVEIEAPHQGAAFEGRRQNPAAFGGERGERRSCDSPGAGGSGPDHAECRGRDAVGPHARERRTEGVRCLLADE